MAYYGKNMGCIPVTDAAGITKPFNWPSHKGIDIGWAIAPECAVTAWQDGVVVQRGYGSEVGNYIVVEHYYDDSDEKRWTGYIHLAYFPTVKVGEKVYLGKQMGNATRGNTGKSNGAHLHLYLTKCVSQKVPYTWDTMLANSIDPYPYMGWSKEYNPLYISSEWKKELKMIDYPKPVERNEKVNQCQIKSDTRRMRKTPSLSGASYDDYCKKGIYDIYDMTVVDNYTWGLIAEISGNKFWVAIMDGEYLPKKEIVYPEPVERDETVYQCEIKSDTRKLRAQPTLQGEEYEKLCKKGIYNVLEWKTADGYDWALIAVIDENEFWVAVMAGEDLPITDYQKLYEEEKKRNEELIKQNKVLIDENDSLKVELASAEDKLKDLDKQLLEVQAELINANAKLAKIKAIIEEE